MLKESMLINSLAYRYTVLSDFLLFFFPPTLWLDMKQYRSITNIPLVNT